jgi:hypothetical protein
VVARTFTVLRQELGARLAKDGRRLEWAEVIRTWIASRWWKWSRTASGSCYGGEVHGARGTVFRAAGVAVPPAIQKAMHDPADPDPVLGATKHINIIICK